MTYQFEILSPGLHETAEAAINWFIQEWGIKKSRMQVEVAFDPDINFKPTFVAQLDDGHLLCIDVSQNIYSNTLDSVALRCLQKALPVKLFVAVPKNVKDIDYSIKLKTAKLAGVGLLDVDTQSGTIIQNAISLSLLGLRPIQLSEFPARYRQALQQAQQTFRDSDPSKGCSLVYDELEGVCRRLAKKCAAKGLWKAGSLDPDRDSWATVLESLDKGLNRGNQQAKKVTHALLARLLGVTTHRNDAGHKPKTLKERIKRDQALRTRFESAIDLLKELLDATSSFKV